MKRELLAWNLLKPVCNHCIEMEAGDLSPCKASCSRKPLSRDPSILQQSNSSKKVKINVGGQVHEAFASTLKNVPDSPLALILQENYKDMLDFDKENGELFFDRHPEVFSQVLDYFQTGKLHYPRSICGPLFEEELKFWGIEEQQMETCCWHTYTHHRVTQDHLKIFAAQQDDEEARLHDAELGRVIKFYDDNNNIPTQRDTLKYRVWRILDEPSSSSAAKVSVRWKVQYIQNVTFYNLGYLFPIAQCIRSFKKDENPIEKPI